MGNLETDGPNLRALMEGYSGAYVEHEDGSCDVDTQGTPVTREEVITAAKADGLELYVSWEEEYSFDWPDE